MKSKSPKVGLTVAEETKLLRSLQEFADWIIERKIVTSFPDKLHLEDLPFADEDWVMRYDNRTGGVSFNTFLRKKCSFEYFSSIILHEFFHLAVQKVPNKEDATRIKDDFGGELMKLIDIEADFYTALFYKEKLGYDLVDYLKLYYEGSRVFQDKWIRVAKLERYLGTLLSISKMFIENNKPKKPVTVFDLYLVSIGPFFTEQNLHVLVIRKEHIYFDEIHANMDDLRRIRECYTNDEEFPLKSYVKRIVEFVGKALGLKIDSTMESKINSL